MERDVASFAAASQRCLSICSNKTITFIFCFQFKCLQLVTKIALIPIQHFFRI